MNIKKLFGMASAALFVVVGTTDVKLNASATTKSATDVVEFADTGSVELGKALFYVTVVVVLIVDRVSPNN
ncbi:hypothetical protein RZE82_05610 [Mollicutes bacterium LVI A0039]|nr:hypothetical protein RZE82_05610 [Mollicutes bacterium LVI A0039]